MKMDLQNQQRENVIVLGSYAFLVWLLVFTTRTFFSGFHLSDDQILIGYNNRLQHESFFSVANFQIRNDLFLRFRPLAILYYVVLAKFVYPNFNLISFLVSMQGILTCYFFYRFARSLKCGIVSFLFPLFILCGNQGVVFWRNCINETLAMFLLGISFFYLGKILQQKDNRRWNTILFTALLLLSTFTKESFIILVPAVLFLKIWQQGLNSGIGFSGSFKKNVKLIAFFSLVTIGEIAIIYYYKNHSDHFIEYVSVDKNSFLFYNLLTSIMRLWITKGYLIIILPVIFLILFKRKKYNYNKENQSFFLPLTSLFLLVTIPQILLYSKSLIFERYLLPGTMGAALMILFLQKYIVDNLNKLWLAKLFLSACSLLLFFQIFLMTKGASGYANTGYEVKKMLNTIIQNTIPADTILIVADAKTQDEHVASARAYLSAEIGGKRKNIFIEPVIDSTLILGSSDQVNQDNFMMMAKGINYSNILNSKNIACLVFVENVTARFMSAHPNFDTTLYSKINDGEFSILIKK